MIGIVVVAHFNLAREMVAATELIVGKQEQFQYVDIFPDEDVDKIKKKLTDALKSVDAGQGAVILTDMFGGTPSNISLSFLEAGQGGGSDGHEPPDAHQARDLPPGQGPLRAGGFYSELRQEEHIPRNRRVEHKEGRIALMEGIFTIRNRLGLHARAAAQFVKKASSYQSNVWVEKDGQKVNGKSIMGLLMLACPLGTKLTVMVDGTDEQDAFDDLRRLIEDGFGET